MAVFLGFDVHRARVTFDALDVDTGEVPTGRVRPANRDAFARFFVRFDGTDLVAAVEATTGRRFVVGLADARLSAARGSIDPLSVRIVRPRSTRAADPDTARERRR